MVDEAAFHAEVARDARDPFAVGLALVITGGRAHEDDLEIRPVVDDLRGHAHQYLGCLDHVEPADREDHRIGRVGVQNRRPRFPIRRVRDHAYLATEPALVAQPVLDDRRRRRHERGVLDRQVLEVRADRARTPGGS